MTREQEQQTAREIRSRYTERETTKTDELRRLDREAKRPAEVFAYLYGIVGALILGVGMCLAMKVIGNLMPLGIVIGLLGIAMTATTYPIYGRLLRARKKRYADRILRISDELLGQ